MKKLFSIIAAALFATSMFAAQATITPGTNGYDDNTVNGKAAVKVGTSSKGGDLTVTVGAGATSLSLYAVAWKGVTGLVLNITAPEGVTITPNSITLNPNDAISGSAKAFTIDDVSGYKYNFTISGATAETAFKFETASAKRFVMWDAVYATGSEPVTLDPVIAGDAYFISSATVTITAEDNCEIYYTDDGSEPMLLAGELSGSTKIYTAPFTVNETTTIKAFAVNLSTEVSSSVVEKTFTKVAQYDVAEAIAAGLNKGDVIVLRGVVTNMAAKGSNFATYGSLKIYVKDATGAAGEFQLFNCMSLENAKFTTTTPAYDPESTQWADFTSVTDANGNKLNVGDTVIAFGKYELYNEVYELQQGCYLLEIKEGQAPQPEVIEMTYTTTDGLEWQDATADEGWWQIILDGVFSLSNAGTVASPAGTYAAADLDALYSYVVSGSTKVTFTEGSITVAVDENEVVTIKGQLVGTDGNAYKFDLTFNPDEYVVDPYKYDEDQDFTATFSSYSVEEESDGEFSIMAISDGKGVVLTAFLPTGATAEQAAGKTFPINDSGDEQTVAAGYYDGTEGVMPSYAALINTSYQITNVWYLVSGTVTVDANLNITVAAKNSKGRNINIQLNNPSTGLQDVKTVEKLVKYIQNGQIMINVNGAQYNVNGARVK